MNPSFVVLLTLILFGIAASAAATAAAADGTDFKAWDTGRSNCPMDFPAGRCGGHAETGVKWVAPAAGSIKVSGGVWKLRNSADANLTLWIQGRVVIQACPIPAQSTEFNSRTPLTLAAIVTAAGTPGALEGIAVRPGDEVIARIAGNDYAGIDLKIESGSAHWDLAADFTNTANPNGPWSYGQVHVDPSGRATLEVYSRHTPEFGHGQFLPGQDAWGGETQPWFFSMMRSRGLAQVDHEVRFTTERTVMVEALREGRYVSRYWSSDARINVAYERYSEPAFRLDVDGKTATDEWRWVSQSEVPDLRRGSRHIVIELANDAVHVGVKLHTMLDGTAVITRWMEIANTGGKQTALTCVQPWTPTMVCARTFWGEANPPVRFDTPFTVGRFAKVDHCWEGWFQWEPVKVGRSVYGCDRGQCYDDPFFIVRNEGTGQIAIGSLAWTANWQMELDRGQEGTHSLRIGIGPWATDALRVVAPGETVTSPALHLALVHANLDAAVQTMHDHVRRSVLPERSASRSYLVQYAACGEQGYLSNYVGEVANFTDAAVRTHIDLAAAVGSELFIMDAGWWSQQGDWEHAHDRFPNGLTPLVEYARRKGMLFGLYAEIEKANPGCKISQEHPEWLTWHRPYAILDLTRPDAAAWMEAQICGLVERYKLDLFRLDFNTPTSERFEGESADRGGVAENRYWRYYDAVQQIFGRVHRKYPDLILQQAACGGGRNDLATSSLFHEQYLTDGLRLPYIVQNFAGQTLSLPPETFAVATSADAGGGTGHAENLDTYLRVTFATSTPWVFLTLVAPSLQDLSAERKGRILHYAEMYKRFIRPILPTCKVYHHEPVNARGGVESSGWFAMEFASPDRKRGWALIIRIGRSASDTYVFRPRGLDRSKSYRVTVDSTGDAIAVTGLELARDGIPSTLEGLAASELFLFEAK